MGNQGCFWLAPNLCNPQPPNRPKFNKSSSLLHPFFLSHPNPCNSKLKQLWFQPNSLPFKLWPYLSPAPLSSASFFWPPERRKLKAEDERRENPSPLHAARPQQAHPIIKELLFYHINSFFKRPQWGPNRTSLPWARSSWGKMRYFHHNTCMQMEIIMVLHTVLTFNGRDHRQFNVSYNSLLKCAAAQDFWELFYSGKIRSCILLDSIFLHCKTMSIVCVYSLELSKRHPIDLSNLC